MEIITDEEFDRLLSNLDHITEIERAFTESQLQILCERLKVNTSVIKLTLTNIQLEKESVASLVGLLRMNYNMQIHADGNKEIMQLNYRNLSVAKKLLEDLVKWVGEDHNEEEYAEMYERLFPRLHFVKYIAKNYPEASHITDFSSRIDEIYNQGKEALHKISDSLNSPRIIMKTEPDLHSDRIVLPIEQSL